MKLILVSALGCVLLFGAGCATTDDKGFPRDTPAVRALYFNVGNNIELARKIDAKVKEVRAAKWRGNKDREDAIKRAIAPLLGGDETETERVFMIIAAQPEY